MTTPDNRSIQLILAGDLCMRDLCGQIDEAQAMSILRDVQPILDQADVRLVNLENPLIADGTPIRKSGPNLSGLPGNISFLTAGRFDCAILANNHLGDYGPAGVLQTLDLLDARHIGHVGGGRSLSDSYKPWFFEKNGLTLAVLAVAENEFGGATADRPGMAAFSLGRLAQAMDEARQQAAFVIVVIHGGNEYNPLPSPRVVERYRLIARLGADAVIGMHTHCPQGYEIYNGAPIVYSAGNFLFHHDENSDPRSSWYYGYLPRLTCNPGRGIDLEVIPYRFDPACTLITPFSGRQREQMTDYLADISRRIQDPESIADYFKGWCLIGGAENIKKLVFQEKYLDGQDWTDTKDFLILRNLLTCEAHHEVMTNLLLMIENRQIGFARVMAEEIKKLQIMPV